MRPMAGLGPRTGVVRVAARVDGMAQLRRRESIRDPSAETICRDTTFTSVARRTSNRTTGPHYRRGPLPIIHHPTTPASQSRTQPHYHNHTTVFRHCPRTPFLRVPPHPPRHLRVRRPAPLRRPVRIHDRLRLVRHLPVFADRIPSGRHRRPQLLQLVWAPPVVGPGGWLGRAVKFAAPV